MTAPSSVAAPSELFTRDHDNGVLTLTLNTPRNLNALSLAMLEALIAEFEAIAGDGQARVVILAGVGSALSAGHDLKEIQAHTGTIATEAAAITWSCSRAARLSCRPSSRCRSR